MHIINLNPRHFERHYANKKKIIIIIKNCFDICYIQINPQTTTMRGKENNFEKRIGVEFNIKYLHINIFPCSSNYLLYGVFQKILCMALCSRQVFSIHHNCELEGLRATRERFSIKISYPLFVALTSSYSIQHSWIWYIIQM